MKKKFLSFALVFALILGFVPIFSYSANATEQYTATVSISPASLVYRANTDIVIEVDYTTMTGTITFTLVSTTAYGLVGETDTYKEQVATLTDYGMAAFDISFDTDSTNYAWKTENWVWSNDIYAFDAKDDGSYNTIPCEFYFASDKSSTGKSYFVDYDGDTLNFEAGTVSVDDITVETTPEPTVEPTVTPSTTPDTTTGIEFNDVSSSDWFSNSVEAVVAVGLVNGKSDGEFAPYDNITLAEAVKLAAVTHSYLSGNDYFFITSDPWYETYVSYIDSYAAFPSLPTWLYDYNAAVTREMFADIMAGVYSALSDAEQNKNSVSFGDIPDVYDTLSVYQLYRAGIMVGSDSSGTFNPTSNILRSEVAAIIHRFIDESERKTFGTDTSYDDDGDLTGFVNTVWTWEREGTEGYDSDTWTTGKYVREDGMAVLYIDSSSSPDYVAFTIYATADGLEPYQNVDAENGVYFTTAEGILSSLKSCSTTNINMTWKSNSSIYVALKSEYYDSDTTASPLGYYYLVRAK